MKDIITSIEFSELTGEDHFTSTTQTRISLRDEKGISYEIHSSSELHMKTDEENIDKIIDEVSYIIPKINRMNIDITNWQNKIRYSQELTGCVDNFGNEELIECFDEVLRENYLEEFPY